MLLLAVLVLTTTAWLRGAEYDEQYTLFLTAGTARPTWPETVFRAGAIPAVQSGRASLASVAHDLRTTDVHPPLYFWAVSVWRGVAGPELFEARLFSVLCGLVSLAAVGLIARRCGIPPWLAMLLTLGSYGFAYTNAIARGFAPAQALILCGVALLIGRRTRLGTLAAGALFGAACCCNYLAIFVATAATMLAGGWLIIPAAAPFLALDGWFFAAQHGARDGQFPPFSLFFALPRLAAYQVANVFGGLPLYMDGVVRIIVSSAIGVLVLGLLLVVLRARPLSAGPSIRMLLGAATAPLAGLLLLGAVFNNTPIELRYLSFGVPFIALLTAWACRSYGQHVPEAAAKHGSGFLVMAGAGSPFRACGDADRGADGRRAPAMTLFRERGTCRERPRRPPAWTGFMLIAVLSVQLASIVGLVTGSRTMQPARATAKAAVSLADATVVLVPRGNDGVGIVGAFGLEAPPSLPILLVSAADSVNSLRARISAYRRVVLALLAQDRDSTASLPIMRKAMAGPGWRRVATGFNVEAYERTAEGE